MQRLTQHKRLGKVRLLPDDLIKIEALMLEGTDPRHSTTYRVTSHGPISYAYDSITELLEADQTPATLANLQFTFMDHSRDMRMDVEIKRTSGTISATAPLEMETHITKKLTDLYDYLQARPRLKALAKMYGSQVISATVFVLLLIPYLFATMTADSYFIIFLFAVPMTIHILLAIAYGLAANQIILRP